MADHPPAMSASYRLTPRDLVALILAFPLTLVHLLYTWWVGYQLFKDAQDSHGVWTVYGGFDWAWICPVHLPGSYVLALGMARPDMTAAGLPGTLLILAGSLFAGFALALLLAHAIGPRGSRLGSRYWRLWLCLLTWGWIPVPAIVAWVYFWTVYY